MPARSGTFLTFQWNAVMDGRREGQADYSFSPLPTPRTACALRPARLSIAGVNREPLIELRGVSCARAEAGVCARIADVSFVIEPGTVTLLVGEVGCGKNLLLRLLGLLEIPDSGEVIFSGQPTARRLAM